MFGKISYFPKDKLTVLSYFLPGNSLSTSPRISRIKFQFSKHYKELREILSSNVSTPE